MDKVLEQTFETQLINSYAKKLRACDGGKNKRILGDHLLPIFEAEKTELEKINIVFV